MPLLRTIVRSTLEDYTAPLQEALDAVHAAGGGEVVLTPGAFPYSGNLRVRDRTTLRGAPGSTLVARNPAASSVLVSGEDVAVRDLTLTGSAQQRTGSDNAMGIRAAGCTRLTIENVGVRGTAAAGILLRACADFRINGCTVAATLADGIHVTERSHHGTIMGNRLLGTGDDGIACVGYEKDGGVVSHVTISGNVVNGGRARGIACLGGHHVTISGNVISDTAAAGVYVVQEPSYNTYGSRCVVVSGNVMTNVSQRVGHGGIFIRGGPGTRRTRDGQSLTNAVELVTLTGNILDGSRNDGLFVGENTRWIVGRGNLVSNIVRRPVAVSKDGNDVEATVVQ